MQDVRRISSSERKEPTSNKGFDSMFKIDLKQFAIMKIIIFKHLFKNLWGKDPIAFFGEFISLKFYQFFVLISNSSLE